MFKYEVTTQPTNTKMYLVEIAAEFTNADGDEFLRLRFFNRLSKKTQLKYILGKTISIDKDFKHPRAAKLKKVYIKQSYVDLELNIYDSL